MQDHQKLQPKCGVSLGLWTTAHVFPNFETLAEPLRKLTRSDSEWVWGEIQQDAFDRLWVTLTSDCVVAHYDQSADTELRVDANSSRSLCQPYFV